MEVYCVFKSLDEYGVVELMEIFADYTKAEKYIEDLSEDDNENSDDYYIKSWIVWR